MTLVTIQKADTWADRRARSSIWVNQFPYSFWSSICTSRVSVCFHKYQNLSRGDNDNYSYDISIDTAVVIDIKSLWKNFHWNLFLRLSLLYLFMYFFPQPINRSFSNVLAKIWHTTLLKLNWIGWLARLTFKQTIVWNKLEFSKFVGGNR